ncbi:dipeptide epimerase [Caulobacter sp. HMWF025]|uniref:dipeptide epimerase n=2 Tax=unclassified Caulobacter TaxID=2648921 RepID=UPI000D3B5C0B|nr:dipeptide epimerase [Caulobacter sp. HMWF025]PTT06351.1 dipeptide epimerase [Caulobacter sp. HMWF025]
MRLTARVEAHALTEPFVIARQVYTEANVLSVQVEARGVIGRGEAAGVDYLGDTPATMLVQVEALAREFEAGRALDLTGLAERLPPGGARNAVDCALWDLEAKLTGVPVAVRAGLHPLHPVETFVTLGMDSPGAMAAKAARWVGDFPSLKVKLGDEQDLARLEAIRKAAPRARLIADANQGWTLEQLNAYAPTLSALRVELVEQPLPLGQDDALLDYQGDVPLCADESFDDRRDLDRLVGRYAFCNIKLDKCGGLTEALALVDAARARGLRLMVGCMEGTSLGIAPGLLVAQACEIIDLDCPIQLVQDIAHGFGYRNATLRPPPAALWG